jgi:hypothetical protein
MQNSLLIEESSRPSEAAETVEREILEFVEEQAVVSLDALVALMPQYSWNQIFGAVDGLTRRRRLVLRRHGRDYSLFSGSYAA